MKKHSEATQTLHAGRSKADTQTNTQTDRGDYSTLRSLACSVNICNVLHNIETIRPKVKTSKCQQSALPCGDILTWGIHFLLLHPSPDNTCLM